MWRKTWDVGKRGKEGDEPAVQWAGEVEAGGAVVGLEGGDVDAAGERERDEAERAESAESRVRKASARVLS